MPVLYISGVPKHQDENNLHKLNTAIGETIAQVKELELTPEQVTVWFLRDHLTPCVFHPNLVPKAITIVVVIYAKPERTDEVIGRMAHGLQTLVKAYFPDHLVECLPIPVKPAHCSSSGD